MAEKSNSGILKIALLIYAVVCVIYGLGFFIVPDSLVELSGGEPVFHGWLRWSGGIIIALGIGAILTYLKPKGQGIFVTTIAIGALLAGLAMRWAWIAIEEGPSYYPNPTNDILTIETEKPDHYSVDITIRSRDFVTTEKIIKL